MCQLAWGSTLGSWGEVAVGAWKMRLGKRVWSSALSRQRSSKAGNPKLPVLKVGREAGAFFRQARGGLVVCGWVPRSLERHVEPYTEGFSHVLALC